MIRFKIRTILYGFVFVMLSFGYSFSNYIDSFDGFVSKILNEAGINNEQSFWGGSQSNLKNDVFDEFCSIMNDMGSENLPYYVGLDGDNNYYNSKQSVFVRYLCLPFNFESELEDEDFRINNRIQLGIYNQDNVACNPSFSMSSCDVSVVFSKVFHEILNDMYDMKQSGVYGVFVEGEDLREKLQNFSNDMLGGIELFDDNNPKYPKSINRIQTYMKRGNNLLNNTSIINWNNLKEETQECGWTAFRIDPDNNNYDLFLCGLKDKNMHSFVRMVNNELFFYRLFMSWYMGWIRFDDRILDSDSNPNFANIADIINQTQKQIVWTDEAVDLASNTVIEIYATFPIHLAFLIYYEDLYDLRSQIAKIITPIYTLYDKLRNVQEAK